MNLPFTFHNWYLVLGVLAAGIPVLLHLLSAVRAPEMFFPTLRFLKISMDKTARRRRLEHWLLLLVRALLLALLALGTAELIWRPARGFLAGRRFAAAVVLDNSYSMGVRTGGLRRLDRARREAAELLGGEDQPVLAELLLTNATAAVGPESQPAAGPPQLRADLAVLRQRLAKAHLAPGVAPMAERVAQAARLLKATSVTRRAIYVFSDMQRISFQNLRQIPELKEANIPLMLVDCSRKVPVNVAVVDLEIAGERIVDRPLTFTATLLNSSETDKVVNVWLQLDGRAIGQPIRKVLRRAGEPGARAVVRFSHRFTTGGMHTGKVAIAEDDDLPVDNARRFSLYIADRVRTVLVRPAASAGGARDPAAVVQLALDPYAGMPRPWPIRLTTTTAERLDAAALRGAQVVVLADVPSFSPAQAQLLEQFVRRGGTAVFFLGPSVRPENYNDLFVQRIADYGGLLPGRIGKAIGQVGLTDEAVTAVLNLRHPYLAELYKSASDYPQVLVQRYFKLPAGKPGAEAVISAPTGEPIVSAKDFGRGRVVLVATTADAEWNTLSTTALFLPMLTRICLEAGAKLGAEHTYPAGKRVIIRPRGKLPARPAVQVTLPDGKIEPAGPVSPRGEFAFANTTTPGLYRWQVVGAPPDASGLRGAFATNLDGIESDLSVVTPQAVAAALSAGPVLAGKSLQEVNDKAAALAAGTNLWAHLVALVILLLVVEAVVANRFRRGAMSVPAHLNPRLAV